MGFEIVLKYYEVDDSGNCIKEDPPKEMSRKIGDPFEEISLEILAQKILAQRARRDIWVLPDVEIYELKKMKVSFRETKGGLIIKNKKFLLDSESNSIVSQDIPEEVPPGMQIALPVANNTNLPVNAQPHNQLALNGQQRQRPIKIVVMDEGVIIDSNGDRVPVPTAVKRAGLQFRSKVNYPVFKEMDDPRDKRVDKYGQPALDRKKVFLMWDDHKREVMVSQDYFVPAMVQYEQDSRLDPFGSGPGNNGEPRLQYEGEDRSMPMPNLR